MPAQIDDHATICTASGSRDHKVHRDPNGLGVNEFEDFKAGKEATNATSSSAAVPKATKPAKLADYVYFQRHESGTAYGV